MKVKCPRCKYEWEYTGKRRYRVQCRDCYKIIKLQELPKEE